MSLRHGRQQGETTIEQRRVEGEARNVAWRALNPKQQLAELNTRLGVGLGATRQRKLLAARGVA